MGFCWVDSSGLLLIQVYQLPNLEDQTLSILISFLASCDRREDQGPIFWSIRSRSRSVQVEASVLVFLPSRREEKFDNAFSKKNENVEACNHRR